MSIAIDIIHTFDELGLQDVIEKYSKEDIDFAIKAEVKDNIKSKLKIISTNWHAAEKLLGAIKTLAEVVTDEDEDLEPENDDFDFDLGGSNERDFLDDEDDYY
ncbi:MAG: hypothetical protein ABIP51_05055 [Bacteroidia bacterium]